MEVLTIGGFQALYVELRGEWRPSIRWIFSSSQFSPPRSQFLKCLLRVWFFLRPWLVDRSPTWPEEVDTQMLIWKPLFHDSDGHFITDVHTLDGPSGMRGQLDPSVLGDVQVSSSMTPWHYG